MTQQIIMICGADMTGKTQIAKELSRRLKIPYFKAKTESTAYQLSVGMLNSKELPSSTVGLTKPQVELSHQRLMAMKNMGMVVRETEDGSGGIVHESEAKKDLFLRQLCYADPRVCDLIKQTHLSVIMDRAYPCEKVYAEFYQRKTAPMVLQQLDDEYRSMGAKIVICARKSFTGINDDLNPKLDEYALKKISDLYTNDFVKWTKCQTLTLYVDDLNEDLNDEVKKIIEFIEEV